MREDPGTVVVAVDVDRPATEIWLALTLAERLGQWFGTADRSLATGVTTRIDFGDGDFFVVQTVNVEPPRRVEFTWRFLGTGPVSRIRWEIGLAGSRGRVTVTDQGDRRDKETVRELIEGWTDFLGRLRGYLHTGQESRYDWRGEIDASIDLPAVAAGILRPDQVVRWLPIASDGFMPRWFFIVDDEGPRRFEITDWRENGGARLTFRVLIPDADKPTEVTLRARPSGDVVRLSFSHTGWRDLGLDDHVARRLRTRFAATWESALRKAADTLPAEASQ